MLTYDFIEDNAWVYLLACALVPKGQRLADGEGRGACVDAGAHRPLLVQTTLGVVGTPTRSCCCLLLRRGTGVYAVGVAVRHWLNVPACVACVTKPSSIPTFSSRCCNLRQPCLQVWPKKQPCRCSGRHCGGGRGRRCRSCRRMVATALLSIPKLVQVRHCTSATASRSFKVFRFVPAGVLVQLCGHQFVVLLVLRVTMGHRFGCTSPVPAAAAAGGSFVCVRCLKGPGVDEVAAVQDLQDLFLCRLEEAFGLCSIIAVPVKKAGPRGKTKRRKSKGKRSKDKT